MLSSLRSRLTLLCAIVFALGVLCGTVGLVLTMASTVSEGVRSVGYFFTPNRTNAWAPLLVFLGGTPIVGFACWLLIRGLLRSLASVTAAVAHSGPQNLTQRVHLVRGPRELDELSHTIDGLLDRMAVGYDGQRRFAANASHELRTPLAAQRTLVEVALDNPEASEDLQRLGAAVLAVNERSENLIEGLLVLVEAEREQLAAEPVRLDELVRRIAESHSSLAWRQGVVLETHTDERWVSGDPVLLERLVTNLVRNGIQYNHPNGRVELVVGPAPALTVRNTGDEVSPEQVPALFEPFRRLTTDRTGHRAGAGLGLSIARAITTAHRGTIEAAPNGTGGGLVVEVRLPAHAIR